MIQPEEKPHLFVEEVAFLGLSDRSGQAFLEDGVVQPDGTLHWFFVWRGGAFQ